MQFNYICVMRFRLFILVLFLSYQGFATHNRAGYISYVSSGTSYTFTIYTYTNPSSYEADRCFENLLFTNITPGKPAIVVPCYRTNTTPGVDLSGAYIQQMYGTPLCNTTCAPAGTPQGKMLVYPYTDPNIGQYGGMKVNTYVGTYTFDGPSQYIFGMVDPNLDGNVNNIGDGSGSSANVAFALVDSLNIPGGYNNNSPLVTNPPIDNACRGYQFCYNPAMKDPDNDSLSYSLIHFVTGDTTGNFYNAQASIPSGMTVNPVTGELCWNIPSSAALGEYDIDMLIKEYRRSSDGSFFEIGSMIFAIQIYVDPCIAPTIKFSIPPQKYCLIADSTSIAQTISASENPAASMTITATGTPISNFGASFINGATSASATLHWNPTCDAVNLNPYYITVQANDNAIPLPNASYMTIPVQVVAKPVENLIAQVSGADVQLNWSAPSGCSTQNVNPIISYLVYRINNCGSFIPNACQTGVPASSGYVLIGSVTTTSFYDNNKGLGLPPGTTYSYIVVAKFADGSLSMASPPTKYTCITLRLGIPLLTNVNVDTTDTKSGSLFIRWHRPITLPSNFDTLDTLHGTPYKNRGPYHFVLQRIQNAGATTTVTSGTYTAIYTSPQRQYFGQLITIADTTYIDTLVNTQNNQFLYKVLFYADTNYIGSSAPASSIFASGAGHDKKAILTWTSTTPWKDTLYYIYQENYAHNGYILVDSTHHTTDTIKNLTNKYNYCFKIRSVGSYENINIASPLYNFSEKICVTPIDDSPPCAPKLNIVGDCNTSTNKLTWNNPDHTCNIDDVAKYYIYFTPRQDSTLNLIDSVLSATDTTYTTPGLNSIAGCYIIVAVDSVGNRSPLNNESCTDNCPEYELPNIFTPNGDGVNDLYIPIKNKYVRSVDFTLYNRWGEIVYENTNPALGWDGKSKQMKQPVSDGVYFYTCTVYEIHYYGIQEIKLKGFVQVIK